MNIDISQVRRHVIMDLAVVLLGAFTAGFLVYYFRPVTFPFLLAWFIAYVLQPPVDWLELWSIPRWLSGLIIFTAGLVLAGIVALFGVPAIINEIAQLRETLPGYLSEARAYVYQAQAWVYETTGGRMILDPEEIFNWLEPKKLGQSLKEVPQLVGGFFTIFIWMFLLPLISYLLILQGDSIRRRLVGMVPNRYFETVLLLLHRVDRQLRNYLGGKLLHVAIMSILSTAGYLALNLPFAVLLGIFSGVAAAVPYFGPVVGIIPPLLVAGLAQGAEAMVFLLAVYGGIQLFDMVAATPWIFSRSMAVHPLTVVLAVLIGAQVGGVLGMLLAIPVFGSLKVVVQEVGGLLRRYRVFEFYVKERRPAGSFRSAP